MKLVWATPRFLLVTGFALLSACQLTGNVPVELQGEWEASGKDERGRKWFISYEIDSRGYTMNGYPPVMGRGRLNFVEKDKNHYHLDATSVLLHGQYQPDEELWLKVEDDGAVLIWKSQKLTRKD